MTFDTQLFLNSPEFDKTGFMEETEAPYIVTHPN